MYPPDETPETVTLDRIAASSSTDTGSAGGGVPSPQAASAQATIDSRTATLDGLQKTGDGIDSLLFIQ